jgi:hypothetical protein
MPESASGVVAGAGEGTSFFLAMNNHIAQIPTDIYKGLERNNSRENYRLTGWKPLRENLSGRRKLCFRARSRCKRKGAKEKH